jgi:hypothetical protein
VPASVSSSDYADRQLTIDRAWPLELWLPPQGGFVAGLSPLGWPTSPGR